MDSPSSLIGPRATATFDQIATVAAAELDVPTALVAFVEPCRQYFAGLHGLDEPWRSERETPLELSFCKTVVARESALQIDNAHDDPDFHHHAAVATLGVIAYLGAPIRDGDGRVLGSVCAIDHIPRHWSAESLDTLERLARLTTNVLEMLPRAA